MKLEPDWPSYPGEDVESIICLRCGEPLAQQSDGSIDCPNGPEHRAPVAARAEW